MQLSLRLTFHNTNKALLLLLISFRWTSGFKISSCGNEPRTLSPRAYTTLTSCCFLNRYSFVLKRLDLVTQMKMVFQDPDILKQSFLKYTAKKKTPYKDDKEFMPKNSEDHLTTLGKKTQICQRQISIMRSKTDNEVSLSARESMKRPLTPFFPLPRRPSLSNTRLSESRASINIKIVPLDLRF